MELQHSILVLRKLQPPRMFLRESLNNSITILVKKSGSTLSKSNVIMPSVRMKYCPMDRNSDSRTSLVRTTDELQKIWCPDCNLSVFTHKLPDYSTGPNVESHGWNDPLEVKATTGTTANQVHSYDQKLQVPPTMARMSQYAKLQDRLRGRASAQDILQKQLSWKVKYSEIMQVPCISRSRFQPSIPRYEVKDFAKVFRLQ